LQISEFESLLKIRVLLSVEGIGPARALSLISKFSSINSIDFNSINYLQRIGGVSREIAQKIGLSFSNTDSARKNLEKDLRIISALGGTVISIWDEIYPKLLKRIYSPPLILYCLGDLSKLNESGIAVVGTRTPTQYGKDLTEKITIGLVQKGITIVSGLARGIDTIAHKSALKSNGITIAVTGSGLDKIYPPENKSLYNEIADAGIIITEFVPGTKPDAINFPKRNRIISGLSLGSVIIETRKNGGAMQTAGYALEQNREVFALPGSVNIQQSEGTNYLIQRAEAKLVTTAEDILCEFPMFQQEKTRSENKFVIPELNAFESKILDVLDNQGKQIDLIASLTGITVQNCLVHLLSLEFKGVVTQLPGKMFRRNF